ncbi:hypothetical protein BH10ACI3_BH10ACI3_10540 [soil metagenome]
MTILFTLCAKDWFANEQTNIIRIKIRAAGDLNVITSVFFESSLVSSVLRYALDLRQIGLGNTLTFLKSSL